ncbi:restriction endonuclease subunit S [Nocardia sp. NPDC004604]|uniref:restriction endonuclease subunit S n=1 Tax=Nocardia sp. NPDC004604 TaxID=3157013 RepID=UPI0033A86785
MAFDIALPPSWRWIPLKFATTFLNRGTAPDYVDDGQIRVVSQAANQPEGLNWDRTRYHAYSGNPKQLKGYLIPGDILVNSTGTGTLGRVGYFHGAIDDLPCIADGHVTVARTDRTIVNPRFLFYWLASSPFYNYVYAALIVGATNQIELNRERLAGAEVPLPPLDEQRRIADFLDAEVSRIDRVVECRATQFDALSVRYATEISELVTPGIANADLRSEIWPWLPASTATARLGYMARVQSGVTVHEGRKETGDEADYPYLRVANVQGERVDLSEIKQIRIPRIMARASRLQPGDVVMTEANGNPDNLGRGAVWSGEIPNMIHQNHVFAIRVNDRLISPEYLVALLASIHGRRYFRFTSTQVGIATTSSSKVLNFPVPIKSLADQHSVVHDYLRARETYERTVAALDGQRSLLAEHRHALITAAVTGRLDVTTARSTSFESVRP